MSETVMISIICSVFAALLTYLVTSLTGKKTMIDAMTTVIKQHESVYHKDELISYVKSAVNEHKTNCAGASEIHKIKNIVLAIYAQNGGKIENLNL